jgi:phage-related protein (TIGR01555 family)
MQPRIHAYRPPAPPVEEGELRADSFDNNDGESALVRAGRRGRLKSNRLLSEMELLHLYIYAQPLANAIDIVPSAAMKRAPVFKLNADDLPEEMAEEIAKLGAELLHWALPVIREAVHLARLYGWSIIPIFTSETTDYSTQPDFDMASGVINDIRAVAGGACVDVTVREYQSDAYSRGYGTPLLYQMSPDGKIIHADRTILLTGLKDRRALKGGTYRLGYSVLEPLVKAWGDYEQSLDSLLKILSSKSIEIFMVPNLKEILLNPVKLQKYLRGLQSCRRAINGYLIDSEGDFKLGERSLTGTNDALSQFLEQLSMQANLPDTLLFGVSPAGLTSGSYETGVLDNLTSAYQLGELEPIYRQLLDIMFRLAGMPDVKYELVFAAPSVENKVELAQAEQYKADAAMKIANALTAMVTEGFMKREVAASIFASAIDGVNPNVDMAAIGTGDTSLLGEKKEPEEPTEPGEPADTPEPSGELDE